MSASAIVSSSFLNYDNQTIQSRMQRFRQEFQQLGQDLQSGNLSAAQQDYSNIQQDFQNHAEQVQGHHHHHHSGGGSEGSAISQIFDQLGQALQSGSLSAAQQAYNSLLQDLQQFGQTSGQASTQQTPSSSSLSVSA